VHHHPRAQLLPSGHLSALLNWRGRVVRCLVEDVRAATSTAGLAAASGAASPQYVLVRGAPPMAEEMGTTRFRAATAQMRRAQRERAPAPRTSRQPLPSLRRSFAAAAAPSPAWSAHARSARAAACSPRRRAPPALRLTRRSSASPSPAQPTRPTCRPPLRPRSRSARSRRRRGSCWGGCACRWARFAPCKRAARRRPRTRRGRARWRRSLSARARGWSARRRGPRPRGCPRARRRRERC
jgi:hypothetical protein